MSGTTSSAKYCRAIADTGASAAEPQRPGNRTMTFATALDATPSWGVPGWAVTRDYVEGNLHIEGTVLGLRAVIRVRVHGDDDPRHFQRRAIDAIAARIDERYAQVGPEFRMAKQLATTTNRIPPWNDA